MEARTAAALPAGAGWQFEPKWDGFRCLAVRQGAAATLFSKSGKTLDRFFPEMVALMLAVPAPDFVLDGELVIPTDGDNHDFDALQSRLHPAESRIRRLARETPARFLAFDLLADATGPLGARPLRERRAALERFLAARAVPDRLVLSPATTDRDAAGRWLAGAAGTDGVVSKRLDDPYRAGERAMIKTKRIRTADCVLGGYRTATGSTEVASLLLGLYDDAGRLDHVGYTSAISRAERPALTRRLRALAGGAGFTGDAPDTPNRWNRENHVPYVRLAPELVVEVSYDHWSGGRFRHGTRLLRWRTDKAPRQCTRDQVGY